MLKIRELEAKLEDTTSKLTVSEQRLQERDRWASNARGQIQSLQLENMRLLTENTSLKMMFKPDSVKPMIVSSTFDKG